MNAARRAFLVGLLLALTPAFTSAAKILGGADWRFELAGLCLALPTSVVLWLMKPPRAREDGTIEAGGGGA